MTMKIFCLLFLFFTSVFASSALEENPPLDEKNAPQESVFANAGFSLRQLIVPLSLITAGAVITASGLNETLEDKIALRRGRPYKFDDVLMYAPSAMVYGFSFLGAQAKHDWWDRSVILGTSAFFVLSTLIVKHSVKHPRPDASTNTSFPSGHTAVAFAGAEIVRREYPPMCAAISYTAAGTVAFMRLYNQKHWIVDVVAGAGFGVLSVSAAYWLLPLQQRTLRPKSLKNDTVISINPYFDGERAGMYLTVSR